MFMNINIAGYLLCSEHAAVVTLVQAHRRLSQKVGAARPLAQPSWFAHGIRSMIHSLYCSTSFFDSREHGSAQVGGSRGFF